MVMRQAPHSSSLLMANCSSADTGVLSFVCVSSGPGSVGPMQGSGEDVNQGGESCGDAKSGLLVVEVLGRVENTLCS